MKKTKKPLREYLWIASSAYLILGLFNILFAWLGLICFMVPLAISFTKGNKGYCNKYCGRGQLFDILGTKFKLSRNKPMPTWLKHPYFRYGFLIFFMTMFGNMLFTTYLVFRDTATLKEVITILWTFKLPWRLVDLTNVTPWIGQFAFGFYSMMLTSTLLGLVTMALYKPRSWCVYCPMGTMTQGICQLKAKN
jgi:hypothetical protein